MAPRPARLKQTLTLWQVVVMGLAYMTPMVVFDTFGIVTDITHGHVTTAYLLALVGVLTAAVLPGTLGLGATVIAFAVLLALGWWAWSRSIEPLAGAAATAAAGASPLRQPAFLRLLAVFAASWIQPLWPLEQTLHSSLTVMAPARQTIRSQSVRRWAMLLMKGSSSTSCCGSSPAFKYSALTASKLAMPV